MPYDVPNYLVDYVVRETPGPARRLARDQLHAERLLQGMLRRRDGARRRHRSLSLPAAVCCATARKISPCSMPRREAPAGAAPLPPGVFRGIALNEACGSYCAQVVEASVDDGRVRVHRVVAAIDCGSCGQSALDRNAERRRRRLCADRGALWRDHHQERRRRAIELQRLPDAAHRRHAEGGDRDRAERRFLGRRRRAAGAAAGAGFMQRDFRRHRQTHPLAAAAEPRFARDEPGARARGANNLICGIATGVCSLSAHWAG